MTTLFEWDHLEGGSAGCPVCGDPRAKLGHAAIKPPALATKVGRVLYLRCEGCGTLFHRDPVQTSYQVPAGYVHHVDFAVEQGSNIDSMAESLYLLPRVEGARYLEVGCGYGFSLDYAQVIFGYRAVGLDPSPIGRRGAEDLGLTIRNDYLSQEIVDGCGPFDLAMCSEVIEHIEQPREFLATLFSGLSSDGTIMVTTPNGELVERATDGHRLSGILSIWHPVLFTARSLELALRSAGFPNVVVWDSEATLCGLASKNPSQRLDRDVRIPRGDYRRYLRHRWENSDPTSAVAMGMGGRLLKELVNAGKLDEAGEVLADLRTAIQAATGVDIDDPLNLPLGRSFNEFGSLLPYNIVTILYHAGIRLLNSGAPVRSAEEAFKGAFRAGKRLVDVCAEIGSYDLENQQLTGLALEHYFVCLSRRGREEALAQFRRLEGGDTAGFPDGLSPYLSESLIAKSSFSLVIDSVMNGSYEEAQRLCDVLGPALLPEAIAAAPTDVKVKVDLLFSLGMLHLNHRAGYRQSIEMFQRAADIAFSSDQPGLAPIAWQAVFHKGLAHKRAGDGHLARAVSRQLLAGAGRPGGTAIDASLLARVEELA